MMRLLIVGTLKGQLTTATKIAMDNGASVTHAETIEQAMAVLRGGKGADLLLVDVALDIRDLVMRLEAEHIHVPLVACGHSTDTPPAGPASPRGATERGPSPAPSTAESANSRKPPAARWCWTKSPKWTCGCNRNGCARSRSASSTASAAPSRCRSISASSRPRTATWPTPCAKAVF